MAWNTRREGHHTQPPLPPLLGFPLGQHQPQSQKECCPRDPQGQPSYCHLCTGTHTATTGHTPWNCRAPGAPQGTESRVEKAKPWMEPGCRQTPVSANESGGWDRMGVPGGGLLSQRCCRWQVCISHSSLPTLPAMKKPLECEPRKQTGSRPEQG